VETSALWQADNASPTLANLLAELPTPQTLRTRAAR
jgi:hypothetical protein